jgi:hypothetical protein
MAIGAFVSVKVAPSSCALSSSFVIGTLEFLYLLDEKSNIFAFTSI